MNIELTRKALDTVGNPHILVNLISRRVRQLNSGGGGFSRPLVETDVNMGAADVALAEVIEGKIGYDPVPDESEATRETAPKKRRRKSATA